MRYHDQDEETGGEGDSTLVFGACWLAIGLSAICGVLWFCSIAHCLVS